MRFYHVYVDGFVQDRGIASALVTELPLSCISYEM